jgi:heme-degrading monooxygenase HmoA
MPVLEIAHMRCLPGHGDVLAAGLAQGARVIAGHPGCAGVQVQRGVEDPEEFVLLAVWESIPAHQDYLASDRSPQFRELIAEGRDPDTVRAAHYTLITDTADSD